MFQPSRPTKILTIRERERENVNSKDILSFIFRHLLLAHSLVTGRVYLCVPHFLMDKLLIISKFPIIFVRIK